MRLLAALAAGLSVFILTAVATGHGDSLRRLRLPGGGHQRISRRVWLRQAGVGVTPLQFWVTSIVAGAVVVVLCWGIAGSVVVGIVPALTAALGPRAYYGRRRATRLSAVVEAWPQGIRDLLGSIQSRRTVHHAILDLSSTGSEPMRTAFHDYGTLARLGGTPGALRAVREQLADPASDRVIELLIVAHEQGGDSLTLQLLREQARELTEDLRTWAEIQAEQNEPRLVASTAFAMPWVAVVLVCWLVSSFRLFYRTSGGVVAVVIAAVLSVTGLLVARRLSGQTSEPRVIGDASASG